MAENGAYLVSMETGKATTYGIMQVEARGTVFVEPGTEVYAGMIVGEHNKENDLTVNICKTKHQTNIRSATKDQTSTIKKTKTFSLEEALQYIDDDEYVEVTPVSIRMRKKILDKNMREKMAKGKKFPNNKRGLFKRTLREPLFFAFFARWYFVK